MTKKQKENRVSLTEMAVFFNSMKPVHRHMLWDLFNLFTYDQVEKIFETSLRSDKAKLVFYKSNSTGRRKYTRKKKGAKKAGRKNNLKP